MIQEINLCLLPKEADNLSIVKSIAENELGYKLEKIQVVKRSIDARKKTVKINLRVRAYQSPDTYVPLWNPITFKNVETSPEIHIIGAGSAGLFAALEAIETGLKPIVFERGKAVRERRRDLAKLNKEMILNPESNYCFGEGGAGTFSDGKLYTRSKKRGSVKKVLDLLVQHGANENILVNAHPHIGTNKLPHIIQNIREKIIEHGGEIHFESKLTEIHFDNNEITGITINNKNKYNVKQLILATGHSARDIFELLDKKNIPIEAKPFALGVRIEHPQQLIDQIQYSSPERGDFLPPAPYSLVAQANGKGVYSFCMCPGGIVAPCATDKEEVVTNGWSPSKRNGKFANSGIVVEVDEKSFSSYKKEYGELAALAYQKEVEKNCWIAAGKTQKVPAQRLIDFIQNKKSKTLPESSYHPGIVSLNLNEILPPEISKRLRIGFLEFGKRMKGFLTNEAVLHAPESRTSSPVRIPRNKEDFQHVTIKGLYPCAEGSGYAGGIVSAAIDGMKCVSASYNNYYYDNEKNKTTKNNNKS